MKKQSNFLAYIFLLLTVTFWAGNFIVGKLASFYEEVGLLTFMYRPLTLLPSLAVISRRLHDINRSGWWCLTCVTPLVIILIIFLCKKSDDSENSFGPKPII